MPVLILLAEGNAEIRGRQLMVTFPEDSTVLNSSEHELTAEFLPR